MDSTERVRFRLLIEQQPFADDSTEEDDEDDTLSETGSVLIFETLETEEFIPDYMKYYSLNHHSISRKELGVWAKPMVGAGTSTSEPRWTRSVTTETFDLPLWKQDGMMQTEMTSASISVGTHSDVGINTDTMNVPCGCNCRNLNSGFFWSGASTFESSTTQTVIPQTSLGTQAPMAMSPLPGLNEAMYRMTGTMLEELLWEPMKMREEKALMSEIMVCSIGAGRFDSVDFFETQHETTAMYNGTEEEAERKILEDDEQTLVMDESSYEEKIACTLFEDERRRSSTAFSTVAEVADEEEYEIVESEDA
jgi:hypothetical protein